ncbi:TPA: tail fiber assembly protein [Stenotrophomonas maltophilia]
MPLFAGETVVSEVPASLVEKIRAGDAKEQRRLALRATDWTQMPDAPLTAQEKAAYQVYRQALRDLPSVPGFPDAPWPTLPTIKEGAAGIGEGAVYP